MKQESRGSVRMGPISLIILVVILSLAVLAMLTVATVRSMEASAERQAQFTQATYLNESTAQEFVAGVDGALAQGQQEGLAQALPQLVEQAQAQGVSAEAQIQDGKLTASFLTEDGRGLDIQLSLGESGYTVEQWKTYTTWTQEDEETLWLGPQE